MAPGLRLLFTAGSLRRGPLRRGQTGTMHFARSDPEYHDIQIIQIWWLSPFHISGRVRLFHDRIEIVRSISATGRLPRSLGACWGRRIHPVSGRAKTIGRGE